MKQDSAERSADEYRTLMKTTTNPGLKMLYEMKAQQAAERQPDGAIQSTPVRGVQPAPWPCPACGGQVQLEPADDNAPTRFWTCSGCGAWGATREGAAYPVVWVGNKVMQ